MRFEALRKIFFNHYAIAAIFTLLTSILLFVAANGTGLFLKREVVNCAGILNPHIETVGSFDCERRGIFSQKNYLISESGRESKEPNIIRLKPGSGGTFTFSFLSDGTASFNVFDKAKDKYLDRSFMDIFNLSGKSPGRFEIALPQDMDLEIRLVAGRHQMLFIQPKFSPSQVTQLKIDREKSSNAYSSWFLWFCLLGVVFSAVAIVAVLPLTRFYVFVLTASFFIATLFYGAPYVSNAGFYDTFDDASYLDWAHALGYNLNPDLTENGFYSHSQRGNQHSWGTGILLAPGMFVTKMLFPSGNGFNNKGFTILSMNSMMLTFLSILVYFFAFRHFSPPWAAAVAAFMTLATTSLIKWTYFRNFFSHSPEALSLSLFAYLFVKLYIPPAPTSKRLLYIAMVAVGILMIQIRKENALIILIPIYYEFLSRQSWKEFFTKSGVFVATFALGLLVLIGTNYFTLVSSAENLSTGGFVFSKVPELISKNFVDVFFGIEFGFFSWWNLPAYLMLLIPFLTPLPKKYMLAPLLAVAAYMSMCVLYWSPNGMEWQNRFLLKLNPIVFGAAAYLFAKVKPKWVLLSLVLLVGLNVGHQYQLYLENLPKEVPLYRDLFSDFAIFNPVPYEQRPRSFFIPLQLFGVLAIGWLVYSLIITRIEQRDCVLNPTTFPLDKS